MLEVQPGWWRTMLKDKVSRLYARVDITKVSDDKLLISIGMDNLSARIDITFLDGEVSLALIRSTNGALHEVAKETMKIDGKFVWKEKDSSNT